ncbi:hypothetical protein PsorP6_008712 [Peronosclerospora sorghi]|uniref:Uncharacterized protein n=1 Tax=Peronosclerospora sorghi TaxID=230839 RepID=A0ACC0VZE1_9STRA|nr:hypothetical protein PsorP6_008712 [Peronosclerospora sorghi]
MSPSSFTGRCVNLGSVPDRSDWFFDMTPRSLLQGPTIETAPLELKKLAAGVDSFEIYLKSDKVFDSALSSELLQTADISCPSLNKELLVTYTAQW